MLDNGINPNLCDSEEHLGSTALVVAVETGYLDEGPDYPGTAPRNVMGVVRALLAHGVDVSRKCRDGGTTALSVAHRHSPGALVKLLEAAEEKQVGINGRGTYGETALQRAVQWSDCARMRVLLAHHADPNIATDGGFTPLAAAAQDGNLEAVKLLLSHGARVETKDVDGETALIYAIEQRTADTANPQVVKELVRAGANVNARDWKKRTALAVAMKNNSPEIVQILQNAGAKPQIASSHRLIRVETSDNAAP